MINNVKTIFFDFDGTLHDSSKIYIPAFKKAYEFLISNQVAQEKKWTDEEIASWLGYTKEEMWQKFMPDINESIRDQASDIIGNEMIGLLSTGKGYLYDHTLDTLKYLKDKDYYLVFLSNCGKAYKEKVKEVFELEHYISEFICAEDFEYIPKYEILKAIKNNYKNEMVMVGDRLKDIETGTFNNIYTIGCSYGYGTKEELKDADFIIDKISDLNKLL
ncbi:phosphoglycolate phosphatase [Natranaerovirga hydrolytica]|uniref:Phosphoglycolate phosphatase n=1 Tax=Natranaerovirga hydrolytica TaxID=680378 RepID=A0A4V2Q1T0_9FIRM|nr:HAD family hydrolase [Natranaerovirga hydrolytica]TCK98811.1 phosphoglycolate phosphatase [Natranaerovirga hydrolytica]